MTPNEKTQNDYYPLTTKVYPRCQDLGPKGGPCIGIELTRMHAETPASRVIHNASTSQYYLA